MNQHIFLLHFSFPRAFWWCKQHNWLGSFHCCRRCCSKCCDVRGEYASESGRRTRLQCRLHNRNRKLDEISSCLSRISYQWWHDKISPSSSKTRTERIVCKLYWSCKAPILDYCLVLDPIHLGQHWCCNLCNMQVYYYAYVD